MLKNWLTVMLSTVTMSAAFIYLTTDVLAQNITLDGSLGKKETLTGSNYSIPQSVGKTVGNNLFHSFGKFNLDANEAAIFPSTNNIRNILSRVSGGSASSIDGLIRTLGNDVNFFLINPSGIIFGENARLDVSGSFVASTANAVKFGEDGFFSATSPESPSDLLTINPSALLFNQLQVGRIENRSIAPLKNNFLGLKVPDGRSLLLVGGEIFINGGELHAPGGRVELAAVADSGQVGLNMDDNNLSLSIPNNLTRADVTIDNFGVINVVADNGGSIDINARNIEIAGSKLFAGISPGLGSDETQAGDITLNAQQSTVVKGITTPEFINRSIIRNFVYPGARGKGGDIKITTQSLWVKDFSSFDTVTQGRGDTGRVLVQAKGEVSFAQGSTIFNIVLPDGIGNAGGVTIQADSFSLHEGAEIQAGNRGGIGNAGNVKIDVGDRIVFDGISIFDGFASGIFTGITPQAVGKSGEINIKANSFTLSDGARLQTKTEGQGNAGNVKIDVGDRIVFDGAKTNPNLDFEHLTGIFTTLETNTFRQGGDVNINTGSLTIINGAEITANTFGLGNSGNITIEAPKSITLDGFNNHGGRSGIFAAIGNLRDPGVGQGGNINIFADSLSLTNGAAIASITSTGSQGDAGQVTIITDKQVSLDGMGGNETPSGIFTQVQSGGIGNANNIDIKTDLLSITNGAELRTITAGEGNAGNIKAEARILEVADGGKLLTTTSGSAKAGNILLDVQNSIILSGSETGLFANTTEGSTGKGGNINIDPRTITIKDGAKIAVDSQGEGIGGNVDLAAGFLTLERGQISAETRSNTGGNINLNLQDLLLLRNGSQISTTAGNEQFGGDGGNINIDTPFIVAVPEENSDIKADAFSGNGGKVNIEANGIFGIFAQNSFTQNSDITASSQLGISGTVNINTPDVDPANGLVELPTNLVDASQQIAQGCTTLRENASSFIFTGRGGLPHSPNEPLRGRAMITNWVTLPDDGNQSREIKEEMTTSTPEIVVAQGLIVNSRGQVELVARVPYGNSNTDSVQSNLSCNVRSISP